MDMYIYIGLFFSTAFSSFLCTIISHSSLDVFLVGLFFSTAFSSFLCTIISHSSLDVFLGIMILLCILFFKCLLLVYMEALEAQW